MVRLRWTKVAIALLLASSALCQPTRVSEDGQLARRPAAEDTTIEQLIDSARGLPPEYAADILLRLTKLDGVLTSAKQKQNLLEEVFFLAPHFEHSCSREYVGPTTAFRYAAREASMRAAYAAGLDTLSLQSAVVRSMLTIDRVRARELFEMIRAPSAKALRCEDSFVEVVHPFHRCLELVARRGFSPDEKRKGLDVELIASQLHRVGSARELPSAARLLTSPDLKDEDFVYLLSHFCNVMRNAACDVFLCSLSTENPQGLQGSVRRLLKRSRPLGTVADNLVLAYRDYLLRRYRADRCADRTKDCRGFDVAYIPDVIKEFNEKFRGDSGVVPAIHKEEMKKFSVLPAKVKLEEQDDVAGARRLQQDIFRLIFGTGEAYNSNGLPPEQRRELAWEREAERVLAKIEAWRPGVVSAGLFHQKCNLYVSLLRACPAGRLRNRVLERYISFLAGHWMQNAHPIEWLSWVNRLLHPTSRSLESIPKSQVLEMWSGSRDPVLGAYATLERLSDLSVRGSSDRVVENLEALTKLLGYVRHFHPSDEAAATDWNSFAVRAVAVVEPVKSSRELAKTLQDLFLPLAPTLRVYVTGEQPEIPIDLLGQQQESLRITAWRHFGVGLGAGAGKYRSWRVNRDEGPSQGMLLQGFPAYPHRGRPIRLQVWGRGAGSKASLVLFFQREGQPRPVPAQGRAPQIIGQEWKQYQVEANVPQDAEAVIVGVMADGQGAIWLDDFRVDAGGQLVRLANPGFESGALGGPPPGWLPVPPSLAGYRMLVVKDRPRSGKQALLLTTEPSGVWLPPPSSPLVKDLGAGVSCLLPVSLYTNSSGTLPRGSRQPPSDVPTTARATRLAAVALAWNVFQHFYPYLDQSETDWLAVLRRALREAYGPQDEREFVITLARMLASLHDGHAWVGGPEPPEDYVPNFTWRWVEDRLVVTHVFGAGPWDVSRGDVVVRVDGRPILEAIIEQEEVTSGATTHNRRRRALRDLLRGPPESVLDLDLMAPQGNSRHVSVRRTVPASQHEDRPTQPGIREVAPRVICIDINHVTIQEFGNALPTLQQAKGIIFDLRGHPEARIDWNVLGYFTDQSMDSPIFLTPTPLLPDRQHISYERSAWGVMPRLPRLGARVAFVVDETTYSQPETWLLLAERYKLGDIVGSPTAGVGGEINRFSLPGGYIVQWSGAKVLRHDGSEFYRVGILPNFPVTRTIRAVAEGRDQYLERAIDIVSQ